MYKTTSIYTGKYSKSVHDNYNFGVKSDQHNDLRNKEKNVLQA